MGNAHRNEKKTKVQSTANGGIVIYDIGEQLLVNTMDVLLFVFDLVHLKCVSKRMHFLVSKTWVQQNILSRMNIIQCCKSPFSISFDVSLVTNNEAVVLKINQGVRIAVVSYTHNLIESICSKGSY